jgi:protein-L-isoaspartate(D-aspartate) O-methyltransferase
MVEVQLIQRGIQNPRVLQALASIKREAFVSDELAECAYDDAPLPIGEGQTISQPYIVAFTAEALCLDGTQRVLEVGTGSGYAAAVLSRLGREVYTIERVKGLAESAGERLARLGHSNVHVRCGDGSLGLAEHAPYDAISVAAGGPRPPPALLAQLAIGGRLVMPTGPIRGQTLVRLTRTGVETYREEPLVKVRFVPLIGAQGFPAEPIPGSTLLDHAARHRRPGPA